MTRPRVGEAAGFTLIETMIAIAVLTFGLIAIAQGFVVGLSFLDSAGPDMIAREKAAEAIESVYTARDTRTITWAQIRNVEGAAGTDRGVFLDGAQPLRSAGDDGLVNTEDDGEEEVESITMPGPDGEIGTADDIRRPLDTFTREIEIRDVGPNLRRIRVVINYRSGQRPRTFVIETLISSFA